MPTITLNPTTEPKLYPLPAKCECMWGRRKVPIRVTSTLRSLAPHINAGALLLTYMCSDCKNLVEIKARDVIERLST